MATVYRRGETWYGCFKHRGKKYRLSVLFIPYLLPTRDLQIAKFRCHATLNSVNAFLIGV